MSEAIAVNELNQDAMSRMAGCYLYLDTRIWVENGAVHRPDGPAVIFPDGVERWYIHGKEITRDVKTYLLQNNWPLEQGLDTPEKRVKFSEYFF